MGQSSRTSVLTATVVWTFAVTSAAHTPSASVVSRIVESQSERIRLRNATSAATPHQRGRPSQTTNAELVQTFTYAAAPNGGELVTAKDASTGTTTRTVFDAHGRTTSATVLTANGATLSDERFGYDESGRLVYHTRTQEPLGLVETRIRYDALGRELERSTNKAYVNGAPVTLVAKNAFDLPARRSLASSRRPKARPPPHARKRRSTGSDVRCR